MNWSIYQRSIACTILLLFNLTASFGSPISAPNLTARALSQLSAHSSACGPVCLMNAFRIGSSKWQNYERKIQGHTDKARIYQLINTYGSKPSTVLENQPRWNKDTGINPADLVQIANELATGLFSPNIKFDTLILGDDTDYQDLLTRAHKKLTRSFKKGLPPILGVTRYVEVKQADGSLIWQPLKAHYIVLTTLDNLTINSSSTPAHFNFSYIDPWGAELLQGRLGFTEDFFFRNETTQLPFPQLIITLPNSGIGRQGVQTGQRSLILLTSAIGAF